MMRGVLVISSLVSVVIFPWQLTALLALGSTYYEPLLPLAVGLLADTLYYVPRLGAIPYFTIFGLAVTIIASIVHSRLRTSTMGR